MNTMSRSGSRKPDRRPVPAGILLVAVFAAALAPLGCATGEKRESVWVQIIPGRYYTFRGVKGETDGETLYVKGKIEAVGYFERDHVPFTIIGRDSAGEIVVKAESGKWMKYRSEVFFARAPYQQGLEYTIRAGRDGLVTKIR